MLPTKRGAARVHGRTRQHGRALGDRQHVTDPVGQRRLHVAEQALDQRRLVGTAAGGVGQRVAQPGVGLDELADGVYAQPWNDDPRGSALVNP